MKSKNLSKVTALISELYNLEGSVNGATVELSFTSGRTARVPMDAQLGAGYADNQRRAIKGKLAELGVECDA